MKIRFIDVGRDKKCWEAEIPVVDGMLDSDVMLKSIRKQRALLSNYIDIEDDGRIVVGHVRVVGRWEAVEVAERSVTP